MMTSGSLDIAHLLWQIVRNAFMRMIFVGMLASVLSILVVKYVNNDIGQGVPLTAPAATAASPASATL